MIKSSCLRVDEKTQACILMMLLFIHPPLYADTQKNARDPIAMAMLETLPVRPSILGAVPEIKSSSISSDYGNRISPLSGSHQNHDGLDIPAQFGSPILAAGKGRVIFSAYAPGYGNLVEIDHGQGVVTRYGHAAKLLVKAGEIVEQSQKIATVGSTGKSTGPHLHFEFRVNGKHQDPLLMARQSESVPVSAQSRPAFEQLAQQVSRQLAAAALSPSSP